MILILVILLLSFISCYFSFNPRTVTTTTIIISKYIPSTWLRSSTLHDTDLSNIQVMINGLPGPMALETAKACIDRGFTLLPIGFTGPSGVTSCLVQGKSQEIEIKLVQGPGLDSTVTVANDAIKSLKSSFPSLIVIDYTHPSAAVDNVKCYAHHGCDFVMGTTGADQSKLNEIIQGASVDITAVIAPNMGKQIVAMQAILQQMSARFPNSFDGYSLSVTESHQSSKADTSGTAKAVVSYLSNLNGKPFDLENINKIRDKDAQVEFGVPSDNLSGHAYHTYTLASDDGSVTFELQHNVRGRRTYAEGTVDAVLFVHNTRAKKTSGKNIFNMIDVLESGMI